MGSIVATALLSGLFAGCAPKAGSVKVQEGALVFVAREGKANVVTINAADGALLLDDAGDPLTPGAGCTALAPGRVSCSGADQIFLTLGDGDDRATNNTDLFADIMAGEGNDVVNGGSGGDILTGEGGRDTLNGNGGNDSLFEGASAATVDLVDADTYNGGPGSDTMDYTFGTRDVVVDLDGLADDGQKRRIGRVSENDRVGLDVESIRGTDGDDRLSGNANDNRLIGAGGDDKLNGNEGNDSLFGSAGFDELVGGEGIDNCQTGADGGITAFCER